MPDMEQVAARFFSTRENAALQALPDSQKLEAFFNCWTRKEAYIKASGDGLSRPLDQFEVSLAPGEAARLLNVEGMSGETARWSLETLAPATGYVAALAVEGSGWHLERWRYSPASVAVPRAPPKAPRPATAPKRTVSGFARVARPAGTR